MNDPLFEELSERLRQAHRRVASLDPDRADKTRVTRRLIAVTNTAKHDLARASSQLDRLLADLPEGSTTPDGGRGA